MPKKNMAKIDIAPVKAHDQGAPKINGPSIYGASPGRPFLYAIPVRGERPLRYECQGPLPPGLYLDADIGVITGQAEKAGIYTVILHVKNQLGQDEKKFKFVIQENRLCLTPLLGWSSWNACVDKVDQPTVCRIADAMISSGLAARGYTNINIDSCWQGYRGGVMNSIQPNAKFPDMKQMTDHIHALGLRAGIYSTPMVQAWGAINQLFLPGSTGYPLDPAYYHFYFGGCGKTSFEENDARQFAEWGFDYLKYDWPECDIFHTARMSDALRKTGRDFIMSLVTSCDIKLYDQYKKFAHMLRANGDTRARWSVITRNGFSGDAWASVVTPGTWFDMDMLAIGRMQMNEPSFENKEAHLDGLSRNEMITHMSMWAFFPCPIQLSCDLTRLDDFTLALFSNEEILDLNQDELGACAVCVKEECRRHNGELIEWSKIYRRRLSDGSEGVAFFNLGNESAVLKLDLATQDVTVRDVWAQKEMGSMKKIELEVPSHGARIIRLR